MIIAASLAITLALDVPAELDRYVRKDDGAFSWARREILGHEALDIVSQEWRGIKWRHDLVIVRPEKRARAGTAILEITGWEPNENDLAWAKKVADSSGLPVAVLFQIPAQPIWDLTEDNLVAHTFQQYLSTGEADWPLIFPMAKSAIRAMDAIQKAFTGTNRIDTFVVTGASKRGWTTWMAAATGDKRIIGIAPRVFDFLDIQRQLVRQKRYWGAYSPMFEPYTSRALPDAALTPSGRRLVRLVDPASYFDNIEVPVMVMLGANDPYWTVDALSVYWDRLPEYSLAMVVPNAGHGMGDPGAWIPSLAMFADHLSANRALPECTADFGLTPTHWELTVTCYPGPVLYKLWAADSDGLNFAETKWQVEDSDAPGPEPEGSILKFSGERSATRNRALFLECVYEVGGRRFSLTTPAYVGHKKA